MSGANAPQQQPAIELHGDWREAVAVNSACWSGSAASQHSHGGGEEIFVIEGVFQDEYGTYPAGSWLRNPPGSVHRPWSDAGCTIWGKTGHLPATTGPFG